MHICSYPIQMRVVKMYSFVLQYWTDLGLIFFKKRQKDLKKKKKKHIAAFVITFCDIYYDRVVRAMKMSPSF